MNTEILSVEIKHVKVHNRVRQDLGDIAALMESMRKRGLLNPIVVTESYTLVAGHRRLEAARRLGWTSIACRIVHERDRTTLLEIEIEENTARKDFSTDEIADALVRLDQLRNPGLMRKLGRWLKRLWHRLTAPFRRRKR